MEKYTFKFIVEGATERNYIKSFKEKYLYIRNSSNTKKVDIEVIFDLETYKDTPSSKSIDKCRQMVHNYHSLSHKNNTFYFFMLDVEKEKNDDRESKITAIKKDIANKDGCLDCMIICDSKLSFEVFIFINHNTFKPTNSISIKDMYNKDNYKKLYGKALENMPVKADYKSISRLRNKIKEFNSYETYTYIDRFFDKLLELKLISNYDDLELNT